MKLSVRVPLIAVDFVLLSSAPLVRGWVGGDTRAYGLLTVLVASVTFALVAWWPRSSAPTVGPARPTTGGVLAALGAATVTGAVVALTCSNWFREILILPHDAQRADMLIVVQEGIREFLRGNNPYTIYHVPWPATLPYGPMLWGPYIVPVALHADVRLVTIIGLLFVPVLCAGAATAAARSGRWGAMLGWILLLATIAANPDLRRFASIGHTPAYWPLLALLVPLVAAQRWYAAAVVTGLLIVARTTMIALAPVFAIAVWWHAPRQFPAAVALLLTAAVFPLIPFAVWDWRALWYALYGSYQTVMKDFVWTSTTWVQHTIGTTGWLLAAGWQRSVEAVQAAVMIAVYLLSWRAIRTGHSPLPWMALALLAFSMTTLWPVLYLYFDVMLLFVCAALTEERWLYARRPLAAGIGALAASTTMVAVVAWLLIPQNPSIDVGDRAARQFLRAGFGRDERAADRTVARLVSRRAEVLLPNRSTGEATIDIDCATFRPPGAPVNMHASLNGMPLGAVTLASGWQRVSLRAPTRTWQIGVNRLEIDVSDPGVAVDRISVRPD